MKAEQLALSGTVRRSTESICLEEADFVVWGSPVFVLCLGFPLLTSDVGLSEQPRQ